MTARTRRFLGLVLLVATLLAMWVFWAARRSAASQAVAAMPVAAPAGGASSAAAAVLARVMATPASAGAPTVHVQSASAVRGGAAGRSGDAEIPPESIEVCGVGRFAAADVQRWRTEPAQAQAQLKDIEERMQRKAETGLVRISARLAAGNPPQQVAARLLMGDREGAAAVAERSADALAYQMALTSCGAAREDASHCARLNPRRWAELDPSDARPWLRLMEAAQRRQDVVAVDAALAEAAARPRLSRGSFLLESQAMTAADAVPDAADLGQALIAVIGIDAAMPGLDVAVPMKACGGQDPKRLGHCRALARQLLANASDVAEATIAQKLADRVGVPRAQQAYDAATLKAALNQFTERALADVGMDCAAMRRTRQLSAQRAATGELAMALALLPSSKPAR